MYTYIMDPSTNSQLTGCLSLCHRSPWTPWRFPTAKEQALKDSNKLLDSASEALEGWHSNYCARVADPGFIKRAALMPATHVDKCGNQSKKSQRDSSSIFF